MNNLKLITSNKDYLLLVDTEMNPVSGYCVFTENNMIRHLPNNQNVPFYLQILGHLPLHGSPVLEGVALLSPLPELATSTHEGWTDEDMAGYYKFVDEWKDSNEYRRSSGNMFHPFDIKKKSYTHRDLLDMYKASLPLPVDFIPELNTVNTEGKQIIQGKWIY